jgi:hypothetical protein
MAGISRRSCVFDLSLQWFRNRLDATVGIEQRRCHKSPVTGAFSLIHRPIEGRQVNAIVE